jgi:hypothetical protein
VTIIFSLAICMTVRPISAWEQAPERYRPCSPSLLGAGAPVADQRGQQLLGALSAQRVKAQLRVVSCPTEGVFGAVVDQQQDPRRTDRIGKQIQQRLRLLVDPVQVLEYHHQWLIEGFSQEDAFNRLKGAPFGNVWLPSLTFPPSIGSICAPPT